jgi:hypothetical protein
MLPRGWVVQHYWTKKDIGGETLRAMSQKIRMVVDAERK